MKKRYFSAPAPARRIGADGIAVDMHAKPTCTSWTVLRVLVAVTVFSIATAGIVIALVAVNRVNWHTMVHHTYLMYMEKHMDLIDGGGHMHLDRMYGDDTPQGEQARSSAPRNNPGTDKIEFQVPVIFQWNTTLNTTYVDFNQTTFVWWGRTFISPIDLIGARGPRGESGVAGPVGPRGPEGPRGLQGIAGTSGPMGPAGPRGERGEMGPAGPEGPPGEISLMNVTAELMQSLNYTMLQGPRGLQGVPGSAGPAGPPGERGLAGEPGPEGPPGERGPEGPIGEQGIQGEPGQDGLHCWDLDSNGEPTFPLEDRNGDGQVNVHDCKGEPGPVSTFGTHFDVLVERSIVQFPHSQTISTQKLDLNTLYRIGWAVELESQGPVLIVSVVADMTNVLATQTITETSSGFIYWSTTQSSDVTAVSHEFTLEITPDTSGKGSGNGVTVMAASLEFWRIR